MQFGALFLALLFLWWGSAYADEALSNKNRIRPDVINAGGLDFSKSSNYLLSDSIGEFVVGYGGTTNYTLNAGYRQPSASDYISLSCSPTATIGSAATGQKTGSGTCVVYTDAYSGYNLSWTILSGSGGTNTGYLINQYNDAIAPFDFSRSGLVGYWKMDEASAGSTVKDFTANGNNGTPNGSGGANNLPQPTVDFPENMNVSDTRSLSFDGTDDSVDLNQSSTLKPTTALTVSAWVRRTGTLTNFKGIVTSPETATDVGGYLLTGMNTNVIRASIDTNGSGGWASADSTTVLALNTWYLVTETWDGTNVRIYINGSLEATTAAASIGYGTTTKNAEIGRYRTYGNWPGNIDDVRIYNRALSAAEIKALYREPHAWSIASNTVGWGARLSSNSTDTDAKWGTDNSTEKWLNIGDGNYSVVRRLSATPLTGSNQIFQYRAEIGASALQQTGLYQATAIFTAVGY